MNRAPVQVSVVNHTKKLRDEDVAEGIVALQKQVREDFAPVWHVDAELHLVPHEEARRYPYGHVRPLEHLDRWALVLLDLDDAPDPAVVLGYHDLTRSGRPLARVLVDRIPKGQDWTHTASHELLEMLADPDINATVQRHPDAVTSLFYAREVCDPCEAYADGYEIAGTGRRVADFVWPAWFQSGASRREATRYDERRLIDQSFQIRPGGYIGVFDPTISAWTIMGHDGPLDEATDLGSRTERRTTADNRLMFSCMSTAP